MNSKFKFIKTFLYFIPFTLISYVILVCIGGYIFPNGVFKNLNYQLGGTGYLYTRLQEVKQKKNIDILFVGSSLTYRGYDPRIFKNYGYSTFNLGSSSQTPLQTEILLERYLSLLNPKTIFYEVNPETFSSDGIESTLDLIANDNLDGKIFDLAIKQNHIKVYNALIYSCCRTLFNNNNNYKENSRKENDTYISGGFVQKNLLNNKDSFTTKIDWKMNNNQIVAFERIINKIRKKNIKLLFVQAPVIQKYLNNEKFDVIISSFGEYYNFNKILYLKDSSFFYDNFHLNQNGVTIYNEFFIKKYLGK
ncbi:MAG: hypothetical protein ACOYMA_05835 [Bacteroidia bacterium]